MAIIGRPREFDRGAALEAAMLLFWRKGFAMTSMNDLCEVMGIRSPSLYAAFGSKEGLYLEALETLRPNRRTSDLGPACGRGDGSRQRGKLAAGSDRKLAEVASDTAGLHGGARRGWR